MTLSDQKNSLVFDEKGDLRETPDKCANPQTKRVLTDLQARALAKVALNIKRDRGNKKEQDIEWRIMKGRIYRDRPPLLENN